jgi:uncharacterized protein YndB with AHSA1/START domain
MNTVSNLLIAILSLPLLCSPAIANENIRSVETEKHISTSADKVLLAFLDEDHLKAWWKVSRALVEPKNGGVWSIAWDDWGTEKTQHTWTGVIEELTPNRLLIGQLVMNEPGMPLLGPMQIEISVIPSGSGTLLSVSHRGYRYGEHWDTLYEMVVQGWDHVLGDLETWMVETY